MPHGIKSLRKEGGGWQGIEAKTIYLRKNVKLCREGFERPRVWQCAQSLGKEGRGLWAIVAKMTCPRKVVIVRGWARMTQSVPNHLERSVRVCRPLW